MFQPHLQIHWNTTTVMNQHKIEWLNNGKNTKLRFRGVNSQQCMNDIRISTPKTLAFLATYWKEFFLSPPPSFWSCHPANITFWSLPLKTSWNNWSDLPIWKSWIAISLSLLFHLLFVLLQFIFSLSQFFILLFEQLIMLLFPFLKHLKWLEHLYNNVTVI